ncbi:MAG: hypothetical protein IJG33_17685 [Selenomonadaceae bacterium]|nr:hypothetical protein [Selenomonadaceae bacterium]
MALKFGEATFEQVTRREEAQTELEPLLEAPIKVKIPKIATQADLTAFLGEIRPVQVVLQNGVWKYVTAEKDYSTTPFFKGRPFRGDAVRNLRTTVWRTPEQTYECYSANNVHSRSIHRRRNERVLACLRCDLQRGLGRRGENN